MSKKSFFKKFTGLFSKKKNSNEDEFEFVDEDGNVIDPEDYDEFHEDSEEDTGEFTRREMTFTDINRDDLKALGDNPPPLEDLIDEDTDQFDVSSGPSEGDFIEKTLPSIPLDQLEEQLANLNLDDYEDEEDSRDLDTSQFVVMSKSKRAQAKNKFLSAGSKLGSKFSFFKKGFKGKSLKGKKLALPGNISGGVSWDDFIALIFAPEKRPRLDR